MKRIVLLLNLLIVLFLISCEKKENTEIETKSLFKAFKNDQSWIATSSWANFSTTENKFYIVGAKKDSIYNQEEQLNFNFYLSDISKSNTISHFNSRWDYIIGGDAVSDTYLIDSTSTNLIQISSIDTVRKQISGAFLIKLIRDRLRSDKGEIIQYKEGEFNLKYTVNP